MKSFLRENPTIAFGLGLPLLLVVLFILISGIPSFIVAPAQYDVLYATGYPNINQTVQISVVGQEVQVIHSGHERDNGYNNQKPRLWRYNPQTGAVKEIAIILPAIFAQTDNGSDPANLDAGKQIQNSKVIDVPELDGLTIDSSSIAPDGYEFHTTHNRYSGNVFGGLFYSNRYHYAAELRKNGRSIRLPNTMDRYYGNNAQFIGWVVSQ